MWPLTLYAHAGGREWSTDDHGDPWKHPGVQVISVAEVGRQLRNMAKDPSWKREVQIAFEYAAGTFDGLAAPPRKLLDTNREET